MEKSKRAEGHFKGDQFIEESVDLALALANRSACLERSKHYEEAVQDIRLALLYGYPENKRYKIYQRLAHCYTALEKKGKAKAALEMALKATEEGTTKQENLSDAKKGLSITQQEQRGRIETGA